MFQKLLILALLILVSCKSSHEVKPEPAVGKTTSVVTEAARVVSKEDVFPGMTESEMKSSKVCKRVFRQKQLELFKGIFKIFKCFDSTIEKATSYSHGDTIVLLYKGRVVKTESHASAGVNERAPIVSQILKEYNVKADPAASGEYTINLATNDFLAVGYAYDVVLIRNSPDYVDLYEMEKKMLAKRFSADSER